MNGRIRAFLHGMGTVMCLMPPRLPPPRPYHAEDGPRADRQAIAKDFEKVGGYLWKAVGTVQGEGNGSAARPS